MTDKKVGGLLVKQYSLLEGMRENMRLYLTRSPNLTESYTKAKLEGLEVIWKDFKSNHDQLIGLFTSETIKEEDYFKKNVYAQAEDIYCEFSAHYEDKLPNRSTDTRGDEPNVKPKLKLPVVNVPTFDGSLQDWFGFSNLFRTLIHDRQDISEAEKLQYLKASLKGEASNIVKHFAISGPNYKAAWLLLSDRYENPRLMVDVLLSKLTSLPTIKTESITAYKNMVDTINECLHSLANLNVSIINWDPILLHLLVPKLSNPTIREWEKEIGTEKSLPSVSKFLEFLTNTFQIMESSKRVGVASNSAPASTLAASKVRSFHAHSKQGQACPLCGSTHSIRNCIAFRQLTVQGRLDFLKTKPFCRNCLSMRHSTVNCPSTLNCKHCQRRHHSLLHLGTNQLPQSDVNEPPTNRSETRGPLSSNIKSQHPGTGHMDRAVHARSPAVAEATSSVPYSVVSHAGTMDASISLPGNSLLATALIYVSYQGFHIPVRALVDPGSQATFVTTRVVQMLRATTQPVSLQLSGLGGTSIGSPISRVTLDIGSRVLAGFTLTAEMLVLPKLTQLLPAHRIHLPEMEPFRRLPLADPQFETPGQVDMLLGVDIFAQIVMPGLHSLTDGLRLQFTKLGWIIFGSMNGTKSNIDLPNGSIAGLHTYVEDDHALKRFWDGEAVPTAPNNDRSLDPCEQHFIANTTRLPDGRYEVKLPFRDKSTPLGRSGHIARAAFLRMERKLLQSPDLYRQYQNCFKEYLTLGHMKPAKAPEQQYMLSDETCRNYRCFYMPHHGVSKESTTTKLRVVFNASQKSDNGNSLNDLLYTGPRLQRDIATILVQWRLYPIALTADIAKMYRQIHVHPADHAYQRVMWRSNPTIPITEYELNTVTFGVTTAPYLALRTLQQLASDEGDKFPLAVQQLRNNFYVDDFLGGEFDLCSAASIAADLKSLLHAGGFNLRKWVSNDGDALANVPMEDREPVENANTVVTIIKTLGVGWNPTQDILLFNVPKFPVGVAITKRSVLSWIAAVYDPLGLLAPIIVVCKMFMQKLWLEGLHWDDPVGNTFAVEWGSITHRCRSSQAITIPRWYRFKPGRPMELHGFCDASKGAYAAVIYLRVIDIHDGVTSRLILSKTRVAPTKPLTIPRLELCGAVLLVKVLQYLRAQLSALNLPAVLWTDSQVVLAWLRRESGKWDTFISNRISFILAHTTSDEWAYVRSSDNPADVATRGCSAHELTTNTLWWSGPTWLSDTFYEKGQIPMEVDESLLEKRKANVVSYQILSSMPWLSKFSSLTRLVRVTAYVLRFIRRIKAHNSTSQELSLTSNEIGEATQLCVRTVQESSFAAEIHALKNGRSLLVKSPLLNLNPLIDHVGILRVGGRLANSNLTYSEKHPIILPSHHPFTVLVIRHAHAQTLHGGTEMTSAYIRATYWILHTRSTIRKVLHQCITCFRYRRLASSQLMANLPRERVVISRPFTFTGVDYAGPVTLKAVGVRSTRTFKGYIAVFICFSIKAFHLELVSDLTQDAFLAAFRRFVARRGLPQSMFSDCGTNFVGAHNSLTRLQKTVVDFVASRGVDWKFIPPASPHFGGLWESGVKLVKAHLKKVLGTTILNFEEYATLLTQIEACLNSRPLCPITNDPHDYSVLTPGHFLTGSNMALPPQADYTQIPSNQLHRWQRLQQILQIFWRRWSTDYLSRQQPRAKWKLTQPNLQENDLVLIRDERLAPLHWRMGRIISTIKGTDSLVRVATIKTADGTIKRPVTKLFKLPCESSVDLNERWSHIT